MWVIRGYALDHIGLVLVWTGIQLAGKVGVGSPVLRAVPCMSVPGHQYSKYSTYGDSPGAGFEKSQTGNICTVCSIECGRYDIYVNMKQWECTYCTFDE